MNWIDINLPFASTGNDYEYILKMPPRPALPEEVEIFGISEADIRHKHQAALTRIYQMFQELGLDGILDEADMEEMDINWLDERENREVKDKCQEDPHLKAAWEAWELLGEMMDYREKQINHPLMQEWEAECRRREEDQQNKTFVGRGLAQPGVEIEMDSGSRYLLGHINCGGGVCDDCMEFKATDVVVRYRVLVSPEQLADPIE